MSRPRPARPPVASVQRRPRSGFIWIKPPRHSRRKRRRAGAGIAVPSGCSVVSPKSSATGHLREVRRADPSEKRSSRSGTENSMRRNEAPRRGAGSPRSAHEAARLRPGAVVRVAVPPERSVRGRRVARKSTGHRDARPSQRRVRFFSANGLGGSGPHGSGPKAPAQPARTRCRCARCAARSPPAVQARPARTGRRSRGSIAEGPVRAAGRSWPA
jgi:hypothetical protein